MPYIEQSRREVLDAYGIDQAVGSVTSAGDLNYLITSLLTRYIQWRGMGYETINTLIGVLECSKQELYRRVAAPYEDFKSELNGDVY